MPVAVSSQQNVDPRDFGKVSFNGLSEPCSVGSIVEVVINAHNTNADQKGSVLVEAHAPTGKIIRCQVHQRGSTYTANFTPQEVGDWNIAILYDGEHIRGSPFLCQVYDANLVQVYGLDVGIVGQELKFNVNTSQAGRGDVKVQTFHHGRAIPCFVDRVNPGLYKIKFTPDGAGQYKIHVYFNTMEVKGSPFILDIVDASSVSVYGENLRTACVDKLATFMIHAVGAESKDLTVTVTAPSGKKKRARIIPMGDSVYQVEWKPVEAGEHFIDVRLYTQSVADSPFSCNVGDPDLVTVRNIPTRIKHDELGEPHTFEIDATTAGSGNLEIMINGGRIHCNVREIGNRLYLATFTPNQPVTHVIEMKFNGQSVKGSPWRVEVALPTSEQQTTLTSGTTAAGGFSLGGMGNVILAPINLAQWPAGTLPAGYGFYPPTGQVPTVQTGGTTTTFSSEVERTSMEATDSASAGAGASFAVQQQTGPIWAEIQGRGLQSACVGKVASFDIGASGSSLNADDINVKVLSPSMKDTPCKIVTTRSGNFRCEYITTEVGTYRIDLSLVNQTVKGSPFLVSAYSPSKVIIDPIPGGAVGQPVQFVVDASSAGKGQLEISVNQGRVPNGVQMQGPGRCLVTFIPEYAGTYVIDVTFNDDLVLGCPVRVEIFEDKTTGGVPAGGQRFPQPKASSPRSPQLGGAARTSSPLSKQPLSGLSSTYSYERREFSSSSTQQQQQGKGSPPIAGGGYPVKSSYVGAETSSKPYYNISRPAKSPDLSQSYAYETKRPAAVYPGETSAATTTTTYYQQQQADKKDSALGGSGGFPPRSREIHVPIVKSLSRSRDELDEQQQLSVSPKYKKYECESRKQYGPDGTSTSAVSERSESKDVLTEYRFGQSKFDDDRERHRLAEKDKSDRYGYEYDSKLTTHGRGPPDQSGEVIRREKVFEKDEFSSAAPRYDTRSSVAGSERYNEKDEMEERMAFRKSELGDGGSSSYYSRRLGDTGAATDQYSSRGPTYEVIKPQKSGLKDEGRASPSHTTDRFPSTTVASYGGGGRYDSSLGDKQQQQQPSAAYSAPYYTNVDSTKTGGGGLIHKENGGGTIPGTTTAATTAVKKFESYDVHGGVGGGSRDQKEWAEQRRLPAEIGEYRREFSDSSYKMRQQYPGDSSEVPFGQRTHIYDHKCTPAEFEELDKQRTEAYDDRRRDEYAGKDRPFYQQPAGVVIPPVKVLETRRESEEGSKLHEYHSLKKEISGIDESDMAKKALPDDSRKIGGKKFEVEQAKVEGLPVQKGDQLVGAGVAIGKKDKLTTSKIDWTDCKVEGPGIGVIRIKKPTHFEIKPTNLHKNDLKVVILAPNKDPIDSRISEMKQGFRVDFTPQEVGTHKVQVSVDDHAHPQSPFSFRVYDPDRIHIGPIKNGQVGDSIEFTVDATNAGYGNLEIAVMDKDGTIVQSKVTPKEQSNAKFFVSFIPQKTGEYSAHITFNGENLKSSPFKCRISDAKKDTTAAAAVPSGVVLPTAAAVAASTLSHQAHEGVTKLTTAAPTGPEVTPTAAAPSSIVDTAATTGATKPEVVTSRDFSKNVFPVQKPVNFEMTAGADKLPKIVVKGPNGKSIDAKVNKSSSSTYKVEFTPEIVGDHLVEITQNNVHIQGSPFTCRVYDAKKIKVGEIKNGQLNQDVSFVVDASEAGVGNLEVAVNEGRISSTAKSLGQHRYEITFIPREETDHVVSIKFNNEVVSGSPFVCKIVSASHLDASGPGLERVPVRKPTHIIVDTKSSHTPPTVSIKDPSGQELEAKISAIYENKFRIEYTPESVGNHNVDVRYNGQPIKDSPFTVKVYDASKVKLSPVENSVVGQTANFYIDAAKAGAGNMEIIVSVENRNVPNFVQAEGNAKFKVSFNPQERKPHVVSVKFNGEHVPGSPMTAQISGSDAQQQQSPLVLGEGIQQSAVGKTTSFFINAKGNERAECNVIITDPNGGAVPVKCFQQKDGNYRVEYAPTVAGDHKVEVSFGDQPIGGAAPFITKVVDPTRIRLSELRSTLVNQDVSVFVNKRGAGNGLLEARLTDSYGKPVPTEISKVSEDEDEIRFLPRSVGQHELFVTFNGADVQGSPLLFGVDEPGKPTAYGEGLQRALIGEPTYFTVEARKIKGDLKVEILNPHNRGVKVSKNKKSDGVYEISYAPTETGSYTVNLLWNNKPLSGSPYSVNVVNLNALQFRNLELDHRKHTSAVIGVKKELKIDTADAGPGKLRADVRGPHGKVPSTVTDFGYGQQTVSFTPTVEGPHEISLYWADLPIAQLPIVCDVEDVGGVGGIGGAAIAGGAAAGLAAAGVAVGQREKETPLTKEAAYTEKDKETKSLTTTITHSRDSSLATEVSGLADADSVRVLLKGDGFKTAKTNEEAEFIIDGSAAGPSTPNCIMTGQKADVPITITPLGNNTFRATYMPFVTGHYNLSVQWAGKPVKGSPFKVNVLSSGDAGKVTVNAEPLPTGVIGHDLVTSIDTRRAGPGELTAQCVGPNKVAYCELFDQKDGTYLLNIQAQETGKHTLVVKYNGENVNGSPFPVYFSTPPDPGKVKVMGPGIEHGILSKFKSNFVVDTKGAGAGQLTVRMRGPKGAFHVEMQREHKKSGNSRLINCKYDPKEPGDYEIEVKWAGEHVPGSPFLVMIFDTQSELERYLAGQPVTGMPNMPFLPPGWVGPPPPGVMLPPMPPPLPPGVMPPPPPHGGPLLPFGGGYPPSPRIAFPGPGGMPPRRYVAQNGY